MLLAIFLCGCASGSSGGSVSSQSSSPASSESDLEPYYDKEKALSLAESLKDGTNFPISFLMNAAGYDFSSFGYLPGFGVSAYYPTSYGFPSDGEASDPSAYADTHPFLFFEVTSFPDYADGGEYVTYIKCTDATLTFMGHTIDGYSEDFVSALSALGFEIEADTGYPSTSFSANEDGIFITFSHGSFLIVGFDVTNHQRIVY